MIGFDFDEDRDYEYRQEAAEDRAVRNAIRGNARKRASAGVATEPPAYVYPDCLRLAEECICGEAQ